jgi:hypothetical protein
MKRKYYRAAIHRDGATLAEVTKYAMRSGITASEALVRALARAEGAIYHGGAAGREGEIYTRTWTGTHGYSVTATVERVS